MQYALLLSLVAVASLSTAATAATVCSPSEVADFTTANTTLAPRCVVVLRDFGTCADDCLASFTSVVEKAPACVASADVTTKTTLLQTAQVVVADCEAARAAFNASAAYAPTLATPDAPTCSAAEETDWEARYGPTYLFDACSVEAHDNHKCTGECLDKIQEGVQNAPACRPSNSDFLFGEAVKYHLVRCLRARQEPFDKNAVLQAKVTPSATAAATSSMRGETEDEAATTSKPPSDTPSPAVVPTATPTKPPTPAVASDAAMANMRFMPASLTGLLVVVAMGLGLY